MPRTRLQCLGVAVLLMAVVLPAGLVSAATVAPAAAPMVLYHSVGATNSTNWAGYAVTGPVGSVTQVKGSWIEPKISGKCPSGFLYASFWVGIDGYSSSTVEQTGTDSDCQAGTPTYYAWYEFYPAGSVLISSMTISPGDVIKAEVSYAKATGLFTVSIKDKTTGQSFSTAQTVAGAERTSAEWIAEAPSSDSGILPLADFGTVHFGVDYTNVTKTGYAVVSGVSGPIGHFKNVWAITMVNNAGTKVKAKPSALTPDETSFTVTWKSAGP